MRAAVVLYRPVGQRELQSHRGCPRNSARTSIGPTQLARKTFWTFSVWTDQESLDTFASTDPHRRIVQRLRNHMDQSRFKFLHMRGSEVPSDWDKRMDRVR